jgi:hypothetical protein
MDVAERPGQGYDSGHLQRPIMPPRAIASIVALLLASASHLTAQQTRPIWRTLVDSAEQARAKGDWAAYARLTDAVYASIGNLPSIVWAQARAAARLGQSGRALNRLGTYAAMGLTRDPAGDSSFLPLAALPEYRSITDRLLANAKASQRTTALFELPDSGFMPEGVAWDPRGRRIFMSSIRQGAILSRDAGGVFATFAPSGASRLGAHFGLSLDSVRNVLWVAGQQIPHSKAYVKADSGRSGVVAYDLRTGKQSRRLLAPRDGIPHSFGDIGVMPDGALVVSDAESGALFVARPGADSLAVLIPPGRISSPQGIAAARETDVLYVADYLLGLTRVNRRTGDVSVLAHDDSIAISGVDGLIRVGNTLVGVQNGTAPSRVVQFVLDSTGTRITAYRVLESNGEFLGEPTHITLAGRNVYFVANSGWDKLDRAGQLKKGETMTPARIGVIPLSELGAGVTEAVASPRKPK